MNSSGVFTQDAGNFERLEQLFATVETVLLAAYAPEPRAAGRVASLRGPVRTQL